MSGRPPEPTDSGPPFIHPGFLNGAAFHGTLSGNLVEASDRNRRFRPERGGGEAPSSLKAYISCIHVITA
jgi:hypothetical protein